MSEEQKFYEKFTQNKNSKKEKQSHHKKQKKMTVQPVQENLQTHKNQQNHLNQENQLNHQSQLNHQNHQNKKNYQKKGNANDYSLQNSLFSTKNIPSDAKKILEDFDQIVQSVRPLNSRQIQQLPDNIKMLSHQLTDKRSERRLGYLNDNIQLSSYVRYYTWWNLVRLTRLFSNLPKESFPESEEISQNPKNEENLKAEKIFPQNQQNEHICLDCGTGPLTVVIALWLARPELRKHKLTWYCLDVSANSMIFGEDLYLTIAAKNPEFEPWKIIRVKGAFGTQIKQKAGFITCANMLNELDQNSDMPPEYQAKKYFQQFEAYGTAQTKFLLVEPGVPKSSRTLSLLRTRFLEEGRSIAAPCPHAQECPMNGFKAYTGSSHKWCNFAFSTEDAPIKLKKLSEKAKLPKERATLSFLSVTEKINIEKKNSKLLEYKDEENSKGLKWGQTSQTMQTLKCRIASDYFIVDKKQAFYACSKLGLTLIRTQAKSQSNGKISYQDYTEKEEYLDKNNSLASGDLIEVKIKKPEFHQKDEKTGAIIVEIY